MDNCGRQIDCGPCGCTSQSKEVTCSGRCGMETDNCGRQVDCGICLSGSCFIGGTRVRMANGADKAIELVEPGDRVLGRGGKINRVRSVLYPMLGDRPLYALNGGTAFVTASHPFLTTDGWQAVDPDAARAEVPGLDIERLSTGDVLVAVTSSELATDGQGQELSVPLQSLEGRPADAATQLYNLDVDGDDTYVANGLVVHNKAR
jgi:hypothetical protein